MNVPSAKIVAIIYEDGLAVTRIILYSLKNINILDLLKEYKPQGTTKIASILINRDLEAVAANLIPELKNKLEKLVA